MEMTLLDWTRMGRVYCLAGVAIDNGRLRTVRPLLLQHRDAPVRNVGWSPYLFDGHRRWDLFKLIGDEVAAPEPPHLEDVWVRSLRPLGRSASREQRRVILEATAAKPGEAVFGEPLQVTLGSAYLPPGKGQRSLATLILPGEKITFSASCREGIGEPEVRAALHVPPLRDRLLPLKDHHLLRQAEHLAPTLSARVQALHWCVERMGAQVAVRLGLSRGFPASEGHTPAMCWLMVDGIFSLDDPQS